MTLNWGHKLTIVFILFGTLMFVLVYKSIRTDYQLVSKEYYNDELKYQQVIDGTANANKLSTQVSILQADGKLQFQFPMEMNNKTIKGTIYFYCSYDNSKDKTFAITLNENCLQIIEEDKIQLGNYTIKISWQTGEESYYNQQYFTKK